MKGGGLWEQISAAPRLSGRAGRAHWLEVAVARRARLPHQPRHVERHLQSQPDSQT